MQELLRETLDRFRFSLKYLGSDTHSDPWPPWFTSPRNYLCASTPHPPWQPPPKDNVTICLFNCLSVTLLWAFSVGVHGFFFPFVFIYLSCLQWLGGCLATETGSLCLGWFHMDITTPPFPLLPPQPSTFSPSSALPPSSNQIRLEGGWSEGHCTWHFHNHWPIIESFLPLSCSEVTAHNSVYCKLLKPPQCAPTGFLLILLLCSIWNDRLIQRGLLCRQQIVPCF